METSTTIVGNLTRDPELKFSDSGKAVTSFAVAVNNRRKNRQTQEWEDFPSFMNVVAWADLAEHCASSLKKGERVIVFGTLQERSYEGRDGNTRRVLELIADALGHDLRFGTTQFVKANAGAPKSASPSYAFDEEPF